MPGLTRAGRVAALTALDRGAGRRIGERADDDRRQRREGQPATRTASRCRTSRGTTRSRSSISRNPMRRVVTATIPLQNTIAGPPVNLAIHPSGEFALVANSLNPEHGRHGMEERPRQQGLRCRSEAEPAEDRRHGRGRQAALGNGDLAEGRSGAGREPRRRQPVGAVDQRQGRRKGDRHGLGRRTRRTRSARSRSRPTASARWRPNPMPTRSRC